MSQRKSSPLAVALLALAAILCLFGIFRYRDQFLYVDDIRYEKTVTRLDLSGAPIRDLDRLAQLQALQHLNVRGTGLSIAEYEQLNDEADPAFRTVTSYYRDGEPFFVFITYQNWSLSEVRLYFYEGKLIRWIEDDNPPNDNVPNAEWEAYYSRAQEAMGYASDAIRF